MENNAIDVTRRRVSVRTYDEKPLKQTERLSLESFMASVSNPFGARTRFALLGVTDSTAKIGAYGFIRGVQQYIAGCVKTGGMDAEGFGYALERIVLHATEMGLGTCWLGIFQRGAFGKAMRPEGEMMPAVAAVGYTAEKRTMIERAVAAGAGARKRKPFDTLFFEEDLITPMRAEGALRTCLEMVRIGPSASNRQPWRAVRQGNAVHFYMAEEKSYAGNRLFGFCMQRIDLGIAACHFDVCARQLGLSGSFEIIDPGISMPQHWRYEFSWR